MPFSTLGVCACRWQQLSATHTAVAYSITALVVLLALGTLLAIWRFVFLGAQPGLWGVMPWAFHSSLLQSSRSRQEATCNSRV